MLKKYILPTFLILFCLALLLGGAGGFYLLTQMPSINNTGSTAMAVQVETLSVITLDETWADAAFATEDTAAQQAAAQAMLTNVQALGGNAVALSARLTDGSALFYDSTETLSTAECITTNNTFLNTYNPFDTFVATATNMGIEVLLIPTDTEGSVLSSAQLETLPSFVSTLAVQYNLRLFTADGVFLADAGYTADAYTATTVTLDTSTGSSIDTAQATLYTITSEPEVAALHLIQSGETTQQVLGAYSALLAQAETESATPTAMQLFNAYYADGEALPDLTEYLGSDYARTLAVTYPTENGATVSSKNLFLIGTSNPDETLTLDGEVIERYGTQGVWGVLITLSSGANTFVLENGADTLNYTVTYKYESSSSSSNSGGSYYAVSDGQTIRVNDDIASALSNAYSASTITQTLYYGAVAEIKQYVSYAGSSTPYAYQLINGDWVRADYCELYDTSRMHLVEEGIAFDEETRASVLSFSGGTPAVYHNWEGNVLTLTLLTTDYSGSAPSSDWFTSTVSIDGDGNTIFTFTFTDDEPLYGWAVNYDTEANTTTIHLKQQPSVSDDPDLPLSGVRVLLDAGHGDTDMGAMGAGGLDAPCEKDVNLALTMATAYRLEQLGATVILTRDDDSYPTLGDRVTALNTEHPDFFISIHHNSLELVTDLNTATGTEAYWFYDEGEAFATSLIEAVSEAGDHALRSANYGYYYVTRSNICPATLLEVGFMTNPWEYESVVDTDTIWAEAGAIAQTIYESVAALS